MVSPPADPRPPLLSFCWTPGFVLGVVLVNASKSKLSIERLAGLRCVEVVVSVVVESFLVVAVQVRSQLCSLVEAKKPTRLWRRSEQTKLYLLVTELFKDGCIVIIG